MRILWFAVTPSLFNPKSNSHNGGGWIASLEQIVRTESSIDLGVAFVFPNSNFKYVNDGVSYYPINIVTPSILKRLFSDNNKEQLINHCLRVIDDFKPDLIQIFGSENDFGLLCLHTTIPIVIHMQGCLPPYHNALFPVGINKYDFLFTRGLSWRKRFIGLRSEASFRRNAEQEIKTIQNCRYFMGRTEWDKALISLFNPQAKYFHCEEALRDSFFKTTKRWLYQKGNKVNIISVISNPWYKGVDLILKTANLLKKFTELDFEWKVYGIKDIHFYECKYKIKASNVNVIPMGTASKDDLVDALCSSTLYVHPSYIDNSPNSVCEAQLLGLPILATDVGGLSSIIKDGETGILFPANAPFTLANLIKDLSSNQDKCISLSKAAIYQASIRHNPDTILKTLLNIYNSIIDNEKNNS